MAASPAETIPVKIEHVLMSSQGPVVLLAPANGHAGGKPVEPGAKAPAKPAPARPGAPEPFEGRVLPIFIDHAQALNIQIAMEGELSPRPMTHDLFSAVMNELGAIVTKVVIEDLAQNTFYASLFVEIERNGAKDTKRFDARPSDCLALAVRVNAPIEVQRKVMEQASIKRSDLMKEGEGGGAGEEDVEELKADFDPDADLGVER